MPELTPLYDLIGWVLPMDCLQLTLMRRALVGLILLAPMAAIMGVQVVNFRMAFFSDAISHSVFAGVAIGLLLSVSPNWSMPVFGLVVGLCIMILLRRSALSSDTVVGVVFSGVVAFGLAIVSRDPSVSQNIEQFIYGDILTISDADIMGLFALLVILIVFQFLGFNRLLYIGLSPGLALTHRVKVAVYQYLFAGLLALVVVLVYRAVGVLLVTAMLVVPAATARNFSRSAGGMFWWALLVSLSSAITGLIISAQEWADTATGATVILVAFAWFLLSLFVSSLLHRNREVQ